MQVYADPEFVRGLSRLRPEEREAVENCLYKLKNRNWDVGLRVKRLKGFPKRVWEARVSRADRLLFLIAPATHESSGATGSLYVLDYVDHDHVTRVRRRDLSASSYLSLVLEQAQQPENVEEEFDSCSNAQLEEWTHEEAQSGAATQYLRAYAQHFVATEEEIGNLPDTERELWLTEEQMAVVTTAGHCVVSGTAGSGKTTMAVQRLLANTGSSQPKLYLAYNPWLVDYARELFQRLLPEEGREALRDVVHFKTVQQLTREYLGSALENFPEDGEVRFADFKLPFKSWSQQIAPATAWSEIRSVVKGACLDPKQDMLGLKEYRELGQNRSADLHQDRETLYKIAQQYQRWLTAKKRYDEIDLSRQAIRQIFSQPSTGYSTIVCDEVQDLTEIQLEFIFLLNSKDGSLFFTGDLNQIINPSGFRWEEVNSHFYRRKQQKPERQHLSYNFRSIGSIVKLADAILRLRGRLIGGASEQQHDHHLQEGRKPRLISSSDEEVVKSLVAGLVGQYAILVRTEAQRNRLKTETGSPFVFTIEEAKGLEFDRTLVWDFFRDQQSLWRKALGGTLSAKDSPALRHELNLLYVATTRPRRWLYFYDPHTTIWAEAELGGAFDYAVPASLAEEGEMRLTPEQWSQQGKYYLDREFFEQASFCFEQAGDPVSARRVNAKRLEHKKQWVEAGEEYFALQDFSAAVGLLERGGAWRQASEAYQRTGDVQEALRCNAQAAEAEKQWEVASHIWSSLGQAVKALEAIRKTNNPLLIKSMEAEAFAIEGEHDRSAVLYEQIAEWDKAIQQWESMGRWQEAANVYLKTERYAEADAYAERLPSSLDRAILRVTTQIAQNNLKGARQIAQSEMSLVEAVKFFQKAGLNTEVRYFEARQSEEKGERALVPGDAIKIEAELCREQGNVEVGRKQWAVAINNYLEALDLDPHILGVHINLGNALAELDRWPEALVHFQHALNNDPTHVLALTNIGNSLAKMGNYNEAIGHYKKALAIAPNNALAQHNLSAVLELKQLANPPVQDTLEGSFRQHQAEVAADPDDAVALFNLGYCLSEMGQPLDAISAYRKAISQGLNHGALYSNLGACLHKTGQLDAAIREYKNALILAPDDNDIHNGLGMVLAERGDSQEALSEYRKAVSIDPEDHEALTNIGNLLADEGRLQESSRYYRKALQVSPSFVKAHINLACNYRDQGDDSKAIAQYREAIRLNPHHANARANLGYLLLKAGNIEAATQEFKEATRLDPNHSNAHYGLGSCFVQRELWGEAAKELQVAHQLDPQDVEASFDLGVALAYDGQVSIGLAQARKAAKLASNLLPKLRSLEAMFSNRNDL